jgi:hypothetical protein
MISVCRRYVQIVDARRSNGLVTLGLAALAAGLTGIFRWVEQQQDLEAHIPEFIGLLLLVGILYVIGVFWVERFHLGPAALVIILASAVLFRLVLLPAAPSLSDDVYRYQWDGRAQRAHLNPYEVFPNSSGLAWLENPNHPGASGMDTPSIYPPLSEFAYRLIETVPGYKRVSTILDLASAGLLMLLLAAMRQPLHRVLTYAWNPTVFVSFAMCGHFDSLAIVTLLAAAFFLLSNRPILSISALALSFLSKFFPLILLPTFFKRVRRAHTAIFASFVFVAYLPFLRSGWKVFEGAKDYAREWENNDSLFRLLHLLADSRLGAELLAGAILLGIVAYLAKRGAEPLWSGLLLTAAVPLLSPAAYPWYFTWSIPFLCFYPSAAWLLMSVTTVLGYAPSIAYGAGEPLKHSLLFLLLEYGPVYLWLAYYGWGASHSRIPQDPVVAGSA